MRFLKSVAPAPVGGAPAQGGFRVRFSLARFRRDDSGIYAVEFGLVAVPFFALLFAIIETAFAFWAGQVLDATMADASRQVLTGQSQADAAMTDAKFKTAVCTKLPAFFTCADLKIDVRSATDFSNLPAFTLNGSGVYDTSGFSYKKTNPGEVVVVRAFYPFPVYTSFLGSPGTVDISGRKRMLISVNTFRNEPF